jgi:hypothetical protein
MFEVTAIWNEKFSEKPVERRFFEPGVDGASDSARLLHEKQIAPDRVDLVPMTLDASWNFYSVSFSYSVPDRARPKGVSVPGLHVSFRHDEEEGSRRLSLAINTLQAAIVRARLVAEHQYAWPDGSLYYWFASRLPLDEFKREELGRLQAELDAVSMSPFKIRRSYSHGKSKKKGRVKRSYFTSHYGESRVRIDPNVRVENPLRYCYKGGYLHLLDLFNRVHFTPHYIAKKDGELKVDEKLAESFEEGFTVAYGHQKLFGIHLDRRSEEEKTTFVVGHLLAQLLQVLTEGSS